MQNNKDQIFSQSDFPKPFVFNEQVVDVFDDMVQRSIPFYNQMHELLDEWVRQYYQTNTALYDLGCSTGTALARIEKLLNYSSENLIGVDSSAPMLVKAEQKLSPNVELICSPIEDLSLKPSSFIIMNYTLQFISVVKRPQIIRQIYSTLLPRGIFFLSEKLHSCCPMFGQTTTAIYENFKHHQGYSLTEIERKKEALDQVLIPLTLEEQTNLLYEAGFDHVQPILLWNNFCTLVASKI